MPGVTTAYQNGIHSARPAASAGCILYACSTHSLIYRSDGSSWTTWMTIGSTTTTVASDAIWDAAGDLAIGTGADTAAKLSIGTSGKLLASNGTTAAWDGGTGLLLDFNLAADVSNQALTAGSFFDLFANQNFTKAYTNSLIEVAVRGMGFCNDNVVNEYLLRVNIDSAGTPVLKYISGASDAYTSSPINSRANVLGGGSVYVSGLSAATHTIKAQIVAIVNNDHLFCRASTNGPTTGGEFLNVQVIEHL